MFVLEHVLEQTRLFRKNKQSAQASRKLTSSVNFSVMNMEYKMMSMKKYTNNNILKLITVLDIAIFKIKSLSNLILDY